MDAYSIYIHIPFCRHRCAYCDFNTYANQEERIPEYIDALLSEINYITELKLERFPVQTIYFGGGTPSLLPASAMERVLKRIFECFRILPGTEISIEANPGDLSLNYLAALRETGINRLSLGMQSANPQELNFLERQHQFEDVRKAVSWSRLTGFDNLSLDLIFGLPDQTMDIWQESLTQAIKLRPEHFSLYALTIEPGTPMERWSEQGLISPIDPDRVADMYGLAGTELANAGYFQYEISNWAKGASSVDRTNFQSPQFACRHNLQYWHNHPYFGFGAGAHGFLNHIRTSNVLAPGSYIKRLRDKSNGIDFPQTPATVRSQTIDQETEMGETMMMGLRLTREGVSRSVFQARFGVDMAVIYKDQIRKFENWGLLEWGGTANDHLRLTPRGYFLSNQVFSNFV
jgi:oxygen-independent coproporphyrinogen-3 oxidase